MTVLFQDDENRVLVVRSTNCLFLDVVRRHNYVFVSNEIDELAIYKNRSGCTLFAMQLISSLYKATGLIECDVGRFVSIKFDTADSVMLRLKGLL